MKTSYKRPDYQKKLSNRVMWNCWANCRNVLHQRGYNACPCMKDGVLMVLTRYG